VVEKKGRLGHPIQVVANRTGLSTDVLRVWERRYGAVAPVRTHTNRRLYSDADIERLELIKRGITGGRGVGLIARLSLEELRDLVTQDKISDSRASLSSQQVELPAGDEVFDAYLRDFIIAIKRFDRDALESALIRASLNFARPILVEQLIIPLLKQMGELWCTGFLRIVHERCASIVLRNFLVGMLDDAGLPESAPVVVATTPMGQPHEFGVLAASVMAVYDGWRVIYLGAEMPADEIAAVIEDQSAKAVALSVVYPADDSRVITELKNLRRLMPASIAIVVGGRSIETYRRAFEDTGVTIAHNVGEIRQHLRLSGRETNSASEGPSAAMKNRFKNMEG